MKKLMPGWAVAVLLVAQVAQAAETATTAQSGVGLTLKVGSTGVGGDVTVGLTENLNIRAGVAYFTWTQDNVGGGTDKKDFKLDLLNVPITLDWHPITGNGFRISAGVMFNNDRGEISAKNGQTVSINDRDYVVSSFSGKVDFNKVGPYLGIGYGNAADTSAHWHFSSDLGVVFVGAPNVSLDATALNPAEQPALNADVEQQRQKYSDDAKPFQVYPVVSFGVSYTF